VLPRDATQGEALEDGIAAELRWAADRLRAHGLAGVPT
jgi:hypothetical protein